MIDGFDFNIFALEIERTATALLTDAQSTDELIQACRVVQEMTETALVRHQGDTSRIACGPGCAHCCVVNVAILRPEAATIVAYLERKLSTSQFAALELKIDEMYTGIRWLDDEERIRWQKPCALLDDAGNCSVYPVRPLLCRGLTSIDAETCRQAIELSALADAPSITINLFQSFLYNQAFISLAQAMENAGIENKSLEMTAAIKTLLDERRS
jgi:Fe-S-cluster containining protein